MALRDFEAGVAAAIAIQAAGAAVVLDDFGSGHSSLAWLASIPATGIKIDPQLTKMVGRPRMDTILKGLADIAKQLDMTITAEGIEDLTRVQILRDIGCNYGQGFAYARPLTKPDAASFLKDGQACPADPACKVSGEMPSLRKALIHLLSKSLPKMISSSASTTSQTFSFSSASSCCGPQPE